jgi:hypothetical protein
MTAGGMRGAHASAPRLGSRLEVAGVLFLRRLDHLEVLIRPGLRLEDLEDVPLVLGLRRLLDPYHVHFLQELVVPVAELAGPPFEDVELRAALQILDDGSAVRPAVFLDRLQEDLDAVIFAPALVLGRLAELVDEGLGEGLRGLILQAMVP